MQYQRNCPQCGFIMKYGTHHGLKLGIKNNSVCQLCQSKNHRKHDVDFYFNSESNIFGKPCPQCNCNILYRKRKDIIEYITNIVNDYQRNK